MSRSRGVLDVELAEVGDTVAQGGRDNGRVQRVGGER